MTDLLGGDGWKHSERAFFGDEPEPVGLPLPPRQPQQRRGTIEELRRWRVEQGHCARASCSGSLDESGACSMCGWSQLEENLRRKLDTKDAA